MSSEAEENSTHIENVDVVSSTKENLSLSEITSDSGIDTVEPYSGAYTASSDSDISPEHDLQNDEKRFPSKGTTENESDSFSSPISVSPDNIDLAENIIEHKEFSLIPSNITDNVEQASPDKGSVSHLNQDIISVPDLCSKEKAQVSNTLVKIDYNATDFSIVNGRGLASSTVSLNETNTSYTVSIPKPPYSRSAENISTIEQSNVANKEINADKILSDFANQKNKASAMQKIPENPQPNADRYARIPKELLPQDLGSIVKNVHGIFSSVSGGLKYAYNNTPRISMQKAQTKPIIKPIPNGKVMNDIFEDEIIEETLVIKMNGVEKSNDNQSSPSINVNLKSNHNDAEATDSDSDSKKDVLKLQVERLETLLAEQSRENSSLREKVKQQLEELQEKDHGFRDFEAKLDVMSKRVDQAEREKDAAVMRYASVECAGIEARRAADKAAAAEKAALQEVELMQSKLKTAAAEKQRICRLYDDKCHELLNSDREGSKVREELRELEGRLKWTQSKLRMEMDAYKESAERVEKLTQQVGELDAAKEAAACNASDSNKAKQLETELHESQAALILCRHERDALDKKLTTTTRERDSYARERDSATAALTSATQEVEQLKIRNLQLEEEAAELAALRAQAALADTLSAQLQRESERCSTLEASLLSARASAETCARREAAALEHAARLTQQHVAQRNCAQATLDKVQAITADNASLRERIVSLEEECTKLQNALSEETDKRNKENKVLARKVAELTEELSEACKKLEWEKGENLVLKKKHASAIKELNRELQRALKRCEQLEAKLPPPEATSTRAGSVSSLSSAESAPQEEMHNGHADSATDVQVTGPSRQALIERIVSLQRAAARRSERCEFLEEHARQLTEELRSKAKLLRQLLCSLPAGAVASQHRDANKKEIARLGGGAMAAVWGGDPAGMTLELSLEMNKRLQAVLEDTLLKNITLKENMDTLGAEISRLKDQGNSSTGTK